MLRHFGMSVDLADDGLTALARVASGDYDVMLLDLQMPGIDGIETARRLRALPAARGGRLPVVAVTANVLAGERQRCLAAGMDAYIAKPYARARLQAVLEEVLGSGRVVGGD